MNIAALLSNAARSFGDRPAMSVGEHMTHTYAQLHSRSIRLAAGMLTKIGLQAGERVVLVMNNSPAYMEVLFAIWHAGLVAVPVNAKLHVREVAYILDDSRASACFVSEEFAESVVSAAADVQGLRGVVCVDRPEYELLASDPGKAAECSRDDVAWLFYTSGTTGRPKGAMLTHQNLQLMAWSYLCDFDALTEFDSMLHLGPQSHAAGLLALSHIAKASHNILPASGGFDPSEIASIVDRTPNISFFAAPTMLRRLLDSPQIAACKIDNIRSILGGAAPFYAADVRRALGRFGNRFSNGYGQGECPCTISAMPKRLYRTDSDDEHLTSVGLARTGVELKIVDAGDREVNPGQVGEIVVRSDIVMRGYWNNSEATQRALAGGWLHTGDLGAMTERGYLTLKDRSKDLIISGGSNIYPREVEDVLLTHPGVAEASVIGEPDEEWGERVVAFIVPRESVAPEAMQLDQLCLENLARFKRPKRYVFLKELPRNSTGKVLKTALRSQ